VTDTPASEKSGKSSVKKVNLTSEYNHPATNYGLVAPLLNTSIQPGYTLQQLPDQAPNSKFRPPQLPLALA
jgi:hypothetical protein